MQPLVLKEHQVLFNQKDAGSYPVAHTPPPKNDRYLSVYLFHNGEEDILTLFLNRKPGVSQKTIRNDLERGTFSLHLSYDLQDTSINPSLREAVLESLTAQLVLKNDDADIILASGTTGTSEVALYASLTVFQCDEVFAAYSKQPGRIHVHSALFIRQNGVARQFESLIRLDILLHDFNYGGDNAPVLQINYKYFDARANAYLDAPARYVVNGTSRGMTTEAVFLNRDRITSTLVATSPMALTHLNPAHALTVGTYNSGIRLHTVDDWEIPTTAGEQIKDYPIVNANTADFWVNRKNNEEWLAIPSFAVLSPALDQSFATAPFSFVFRNLGPGLDGKPVLEGEIKLTVSQGITDQIKAEAAKSDAGKQIKPISIQALNFSLSIPYVDTNQQVKQLLVSTEEISSTGEGVTQLVFRLNNNAVRICYSCISADSAQQGYTPLQLLINMNFYGYSVPEPGRLNFSNVIGSRISAIPIVRMNQRALEQGDYFDIPTNRLVKANGEEVRYRDLSERDILPRVQLTALQPTTRINNLYLSNTIRPEPNILKINYIPEIPPTVYKLQTYQRSVVLDISFPCTKYGNFYQEKNGDAFTVVGCRQAYKLGDPPESLYTEIEELKHVRYHVYRSTLSPSQFLVCPVSYIIGRHSPVDNSLNNYKPCIVLYSTINTADNTSTWVLDCTLMPDISISQRLELEYTLKKYTPYTPQIQYVTEIPASSATAVLSVSGMTGTTLSAYPLGKGIRITIETKIESILILLEMLKRSAIDGEFSFTLEDKSVFTVQLSPRLDHIAGLWESGHVEKQQKDQNTFIKNISETEITLSKLRFYKMDGYEEQYLNQTIDPEATVALIGIPANTQLWAAYYREETPVDISLEQINKYIEDVKCQVVFITVIDFKAKNIKDIGISYRLKDSSAIFSAVLDAVNNNCEKILLMPITNFMIQRIIEYKISNITLEDGSAHPGNSSWITQDLTSEGNIINIQSNLITFT